MTDDVTTLDKVVGAHLLRARTRMQKTQKDFGDLLGGVLDRPWPAQTMSLAEKGQRPFSASEIVAIAHLTGDSVGTLLTPDSSHEDIAVSGKLTLSPVELIAAINLAGIKAGGTEGLDRDEAVEIINRIVRLTSELGGLGDQVERLGTEAWRAALELANDTESGAARAPTEMKEAKSRRALRSSTDQPKRG